MIHRPLQDYAERHDVLWANLYADGTLGMKDEDVHWINYLGSQNEMRRVALVRIRRKEGK